MQKELASLDAQAYSLAPLPEGLRMPEMYYFLAMRTLYAMYAAKRITAEQAQKEKIRVTGEYNQFNLSYRIGEHNMQVLRKIQKNADYYSANGCLVCKQLANQLCGIERELADGRTGDNK